MDQDNDQIRERRRKLDQLREGPAPAYPNGFVPANRAGELQDRFRDVTGETLAAAPVRVSVAGRIRAVRLFGKGGFYTLSDSSGQIQLFADLSGLGEDGFARARSLDIGDIAGIEGELFRSKTGELTVRAKTLNLLVKCLRPLPDKWHGLTDVEIRYRQRYLDLMVNDEAREVFRKRSEIVTGIRSFFINRGYLEVETPMMHTLVTGAKARPFRTHHNTLDMDLVLRIAPELHLKRLVVGGFDRVFEINRNFRNEGISTQHNPEFTMIEFYQAWATYEDLIDLTEDLITGLVEKLHGGTNLTYQGREISFARPWKRIGMEEAVREVTGKGLAELAAISEADFVAMLETTALRHCPDANPGDIRAQMRKLAAECFARGPAERLCAAFEELVEPTLVQPTFVTGYPTAISPLSRRNDRNPEISDRFELFITGREIANGFSELNDADDQRARFEDQLKSREGGDEETMDYDADYIRALEYGLPPTAGEGIGVDRLVMLLTGQPSIRDVILFPLLKSREI
ncbi:MAG: lysine--tRNA ligase [Deltaproteobacteria bacterium]|nr:lysine--tRNA ligase [Deltaproteobacteria bacterium]